MAVLPTKLAARPVLVNSQRPSFTATKPVDTAPRLFVSALLSAVSPSAKSVRDSFPTKLPMIPVPENLARGLAIVFIPTAIS